MKRIKTIKYSKRKGRFINTTQKPKKTVIVLGVLLSWIVFFAGFIFVLFFPLGNADNPVDVCLASRYIATWYDNTTLDSKYKDWKYELVLDERYRLYMPEDWRMEWNSDDDIVLYNGEGSVAAQGFVCTQRKHYRKDKYLKAIIGEDYTWTVLSHQAFANRSRYEQREISFLNTNKTEKHYIIILYDMDESLCSTNTRYILLYVSDKDAAFETVQAITFGYMMEN